MANDYDEDDLGFRGNGDDILAVVAQEKAAGALPQHRRALPAPGLVDDDDDSLDDDGELIDEDPPPPQRDLPAGVTRRKPGRPRKDAQVPQIPIPETAVRNTQPPESDDDMTRRRRSHNGMQQNQQTPKKSNEVPREVPLEAIQKAVTDGLSQVLVRISSRNARGHIAFVLEETLNTYDLASAEVWLSQKLGGGRWFVDPRDPADPATRALPAFELEIHGPPKYIPGTGSPNIAPAGMPPAMAPGMMGGFGGAMPMPMPQAMPGVDPRMMPPFIRGADPGLQQHWAQQQLPVHSQPVMTFTPDQIATDQLNKSQETLLIERRQREVERNKHKAELDALRASIDDIKQSHAESLRQATERERIMELNRIQEESRRSTDALRQQILEMKNAKPSFDLAGIASLVAAAAPVIGTLMTAREQQASKAIELQQQSANKLLEATMKAHDSKPLFDGFIAALGAASPFLLPVVKEWMANKSPKAQADLVATLAENNLSTVSFMAKMVTEMAAASAPDGPTWLPAVQEMFKGVVATAEGLMRSNKQSVGMPTPQQQAPVARIPQQTPAQAAAGMQPLPFTGAQIVAAVNADARIPADLKTPQWLNIIERLHDRADIEQLASDFAEHMRTLDDNLPEAFAGFWDQPVTEIMERVFSNLPIWQFDNAYTRHFIKRAVEKLSDSDTVVEGEMEESGTIGEQSAFFTTIPAPAQKVG